MLSKGLGAFFFSIRMKFTAMILIFIAALMLTVLALINRTASEIVLEESLEKGLALAKGIASASEDPFLTNDDLALFTVVKGIMGTRGVVYSMVVGNDNKIMAHNEVHQSGMEYRGPVDSKIIKQGEGYSITSYNDTSGVVYDIAVSIISTRLREGIGSVHIGISRKVIDEAVNRINRFIKYLTYLGLFIAGAGAFFLTTFIVKPIRTLVTSAQAIGEGNLDHRIEVKRRDELGDLMTAFNEMADGLKQKHFIQESFGRYVAPEVVDMILKQQETWFKGKKVTVTVLFSDIRGFTSFSEKKDPEAIINLLNEYFTLMTGIILKHKGYIDKFVGDEIMAVFGSPVYLENHALQAARVACEMLEKLKGFNRSRDESERLEIGIGLNTGEVVAGNLGSTQKMEYAIIGDNVNIASRLCSAAKKGEVIISKSTYACVKEQFSTRVYSPITVKGKSEPLQIYSLVPRRSPDRKE
jgi:adenylate cyclase